MTVVAFAGQWRWLPPPSLSQSGANRNSRGKCFARVGARPGAAHASKSTARGMALRDRVAHKVKTPTAHCATIATAAPRRETWHEICHREARGGLDRDGAHDSTYEGWLWRGRVEGRALRKLLGPQPPHQPMRSWLRARIVVRTHFDASRSPRRPCALCRRRASVLARLSSPPSLLHPPRNHTTPHDGRNRATPHRIAPHDTAPQHTPHNATEAQAPSPPRPRVRPVRRQPNAARGASGGHGTRGRPAGTSAPRRLRPGGAQRSRACAAKGGPGVGGCGQLLITPGEGGSRGPKLEAASIRGPGPQGSDVDDE